MLENTSWNCKWVILGLPDTTVNWNNRVVINSECATTLELLAVYTEAARLGFHSFQQRTLNPDEYGLYIDAVPLTPSLMAALRMPAHLGEAMR